MASKELSDFQTNLAQTGQNLTRVELQVNALRDDIAPVRFVLGKISEFKEVISAIKTTSEQLEKSVKLLGSVPKIGIIAKRLADVIDKVGDGAEVLETKLKALETAAKPVKNVLDKVNTGLVRTDATLDASIELSDNLIAAAADAETAIANIASIENPDGTMIDVSMVEECFDDLLANPNAILVEANNTVAAAEARVAQFTSLITPPDIDLSAIEEISEDLAEIGDIFDRLEAPFDAISVAMEPIAWALEAVDFVVNSVVSPVVDPLLEALGVEDLIDEAVEKLLDLLPGVDLIDPLDGLLEDAAVFLDGLDPSLTDAAFSLELDDFLSLTEFLGTFVPDDARVSDGLPLGYDLFGIDEVKADFWTSVLEGSYQAAVTGGLVLGFQADTSLAGDIGADYLFGGLGDDTLVNSQVSAAGEAPDVVNSFQGNGGDDTLFAYGRTVVTYKGDIGEYLISQPEDDGGPRYADIQHIAKAGTPESEGTDRVYFDDQTLIKFGRLPVFNMETFLLGYQAATPDMPNLTGDPVDDPNDVLPGLRDFLIGNTTDFPAPGLDQVNELVGLLRDDFLSGGNGDDRLFGGEDDDYLVGGNGFDTLDGGPGVDTASFVDLTSPVFAPFGTTVFGNNGTRGAQLFLDRTQAEAQALGFFLTDFVVDVENIIGSQFRDIVFGNSDLANVLLGEEGDDILRGVGAAATGDGNLLAGGDGQDILVLDSGKDVGAGEAGDDRFYVPLQAQFTGLGNTVDGGAGTDLLSYSGFDTVDIFGAGNANEDAVLFFGADFFGVRYGDELDLSLTTRGGSVVVDAAAGTVTRVLDSGETATDSFTGVEAILASAADDTIVAGATDTQIGLHGAAGNDLFQGLGSDLDTEGARDFTFQGNMLFGNDGDDLFVLQGSHGIDGGAGIDTLDLSGSEGFWLVVAPELTQDSGRSWGGSGIEHFETVFELPPDLELQDLFVVPNLIQNPDLPPAFEDPSDPSNPFILTFDSPNEAPQVATGIEIFLGTDRRDVIIGGRDALTVEGGAGDDYLAVRFDTPQNLERDTPYAAQSIFGGAGDDSLTGHYGAEFLYGGEGDDVIDTVANIFDGDPVGEAYGGGGADLFFALDYDDGQAPGPQEIYGGEDSFQIVAADGTIETVEFQDAVDFGDGEASLYSTAGNRSVIISLDGAFAGGGVARGLSLFGIENVFGSREDDSIVGDAEDNVLIGRAGDDNLAGGGGDDVLIGGPGDDNLDGGDGDDLFLTGYNNDITTDGTPDVYGGAGKDTISYQFLRPDGRGATTVDADALGNAEIRLDLGIARFTPDPDNPINLIAESNLFEIENATGGRQDDTLVGDDGDNVLTADLGDDFVDGGGGADIILVGSGSDTATGGAGNDIVFAADGDNDLDGGAGIDQLDFSSNTLGLVFDADALLVDADYLFTTQVYAAVADQGGTLAERAAVTRQIGSETTLDPDTGDPILITKDVTAADVYKIENPEFADQFFHLDAGFIRAVIGPDGTPLLQSQYVEQSEVRTYSSIATEFEVFTAGEGDDRFVYSATPGGFTGLIDGGLGMDTLDLSGMAGDVGFGLVGDVFQVETAAGPTGLRFTNIETVVTASQTFTFNSAPVARNDVAASGQTQPMMIDLLGNDEDANADALQIVSINTSTARGIVTDNGDGTVTYDPNGAFALAAGEAAADTFTYTVSDGNGGTTTADVVVAIDDRTEPDPLPTIAAILDQSGTDLDADPADFDILRTVVETAGLTATLNDAALDATVFAPTDAGFIALARDLGFTGTDETGALSFIVGALTALGGGDPVPLLTAILTYHVSPRVQTLADIADGATIATLQGRTIERDGFDLIDEAPNLTDARLVDTDTGAGNGIIHAIDRVMLPVEIPASNGSGGPLILIGYADGGRLRSGPDNDVLLDGPGLDDMFGRAGADMFVMSDDGQRDLIRDFQRGVDRIDVSAFAASLDDLEIGNLLKRNGDVNWISVADRNRETEFLLRFGDETVRDAANLDAAQFVFADDPLPALEPVIVPDTDVRDDLWASGVAERFVFTDDDTLDTLKGFAVGIDVLDVSAFANTFGDLSITARTNRNGDVRWLDVADDTGETEVLVRFDDPSLMDPANLGAEAFAFI